MWPVEIKEKPLQRQIVQNPRYKNYNLKMLPLGLELLIEIAYLIYSDSK